MDEEEMKAQGFTKKHGLTFDKNGNVVPMSKKDVVNKLLESNQRMEA